MAPHTITPAVGVVCRCKAKAGLNHSPQGLHTRTRLSSLPRLNLDSSLKTNWFHSSAVQFHRAFSEGATCAWMVADEAVGCTRVFLIMWWSSRRLVCRGCPKPSLRLTSLGSTDPNTSSHNNQSGLIDELLA
ncbi:uncharacterized protein TNCV_4977581 [Trichonephila clavipes]|nr:uncharacterized protein TNCV_4977581 [Trichonephila clavipes]